MQIEIRTQPYEGRTEVSVIDKESGIGVSFLKGVPIIGNHLNTVLLSNHLPETKEDVMKIPAMRTEIIAWCRDKYPIEFEGVEE
ncbi:MAG: hypothetical protein Q4B58_05655 [Bacteroidales bacterium]|nr:hypothetical protein [Bacteroidales bacterium]